MSIVAWAASDAVKVRLRFRSKNAGFWNSGPDIENMASGKYWPRNCYALLAGGPGGVQGTEGSPAESLTCAVGSCAV
ncbi:hypothetical protein OAG76_03795, partial [Rubripirellula sp.]